MVGSSATARKSIVLSSVGGAVFVAVRIIVKISKSFIITLRKCKWCFTYMNSVECLEQHAIMLDWLCKLDRAVLPYGGFPSQAAAVYQMRGRGTACFPFICCSCEVGFRSASERREDGLQMTLPEIHIELFT